MYSFIDDIDGGESLSDLLKTQESFFGENFVSSLMLYGCVIMGTHYEQNTKKTLIAIALGHPNTAKSTALECALAVLGRSESPIGGKNFQILKPVAYIHKALKAYT